MTEKLLNFKYKEVGIVGAIALILVVWLTRDFSASLDAQAQSIRDISAAQASLSQQVTAHVAESNHFLFQICLNTAKDSDQVARCQEARR